MRLTVGRRGDLWQVGPLPMFRQLHWLHNNNKLAEEEEEEEGWGLPLYLSKLQAKIIIQMNRRLADGMQIWWGSI